MKKYFAGFIAGLVFLGSFGSSVSAQTITASQLVELFISLGIIAPSKAASARSAVSTTMSGTVSVPTAPASGSSSQSSSVQSAPVVKIEYPYAGSPQTFIAGQQMNVRWSLKNVPLRQNIGNIETFSFRLIKASAIDRARQSISSLSSSDFFDLGRIAHDLYQASLFVPSEVPTGSYYLYVGDWSYSAGAGYSLSDFSDTPFTIGNGSGTDGRGDFSASLSGGATTLVTGFDRQYTINFSYDPYFISPGVAGSAYGNLKGDDFTAVAVLRPLEDTPISEYSPYYNSSARVFALMNNQARGYNGRGVMSIMLPSDIAPGVYALELQFQHYSYQTNPAGITQPFRTVLVSRVNVQSGSQGGALAPVISEFTVSPSVVAIGDTMKWKASATAGSVSLRQHRAYVLGGAGEDGTPWSPLYGRSASLEVSIPVDTSYALSSYGFGGRGSRAYTVRYEVEDTAGNKSFEDASVTYNGPSGSSTVTVPADSGSTSIVTNPSASIVISGPTSFTTQDSIARWPLSVSITNTSSLQENFTVKGYIALNGVKIPGTDASGSTALPARGTITNSSLGGVSVVAFPTSTFTAGQYTIVAEVYKGSGSSMTLLARNTKSVSVASSVATPRIYTPTTGSAFTPGTRVTIVVVSSGTVNQPQGDPSRWIKSELYDNGEKVAEVSPDNALNAYFVWIPSALGTRTLVVKNIAQSGASVSSQPVLISVVSSQGGATVSASTPVLQVSPSGSVVPGTPVTATLTSSGSVKSVEFFVNGIRALEDSAAPYTFSWTPNVEGTYVLSARVYTQAGSYSTSNGATVRVSLTASGGGIVIPADSGSSVPRCTGNCPSGTGTVIIEAAP